MMAREPKTVPVRQAGPGVSPAIPPATPPAARLRGVGRRFGPDWAISHVDLDIAPAEVVLLAGANGSGKTTLLRVVAGLSLPTKGTVEVFGANPGKERLSCRSKLSFIAHQGYLYPRLTAYETVELWSRLLGLSLDSTELLRRLDEVGLAGSAEQEVNGFSAGMLKRLSLVRARLEAPRLLLLDEPFTALDQDGRALVADWITRFRDQGAAVVLASHTLELAIGLADRAVLFERGQIAWSGPAEQLREKMSS